MSIEVSFRVISSSDGWKAYRGGFTWTSNVNQAVWVRSHPNAKRKQCHLPYGSKWFPDFILFTSHLSHSQASLKRLFQKCNWSFRMHFQGANLATHQFHTDALSSHVARLSGWTPKILAWAKMLHEIRSKQPGLLVARHSCYVYALFSFH